MGIFDSFKEILKGEITCPKCGSRKVKVVNSIAGRMCMCEECGHIWHCYRALKSGGPGLDKNDIIKG